MLIVLLNCSRIYQNIVHIADHEFINEWGEYLIDLALKRTRRVHQTERQNIPLKMSISCREYCTSLCFFIQWNLPVTGFQIQDREIFRFSEMRETFINVWDRMGILDHNGIEGAIVDTNPWGTILLCNHYNR